MLKDQPVEYRGLHYESITMMTKRRPSAGERSLPDRAVPHWQPQWRCVYLDLTFGASLAGVAASSASETRTGSPQAPPKAHNRIYRHPVLSGWGGCGRLVRCFADVQQ